MYKLFNCRVATELTIPEENFGHFLEAPQTQGILTHASLVDLEKKISKLPQKFQEQKQRVICVHLISQKYRDFYSDDLVRNIIKDGYPAKLGKESGFVHQFLTLLPFYDTDDIDLKSEVADYSSALSDGEFLANVDEYVKADPLVKPATQEATTIAYAHFTTALSRAFGALMQVSRQKQQDIARSQVIEKLDRQKKEAQEKSTELFVQQINSCSMHEDKM